MTISANEYLFSDAAQQRAWLREGRCSATELADLALAALQERATPLNAVATLASKRAHNEAEAADAALKAGRDLGPLYGIPYGAKDLLATGDLPTSWGVAQLRDQQFGEDATVIRLLKESGAVLAAKLSMVELAGVAYEQPNASLTGPGKNPWNPGTWSGGSSSGSGSAVACGALPFAIGSETWGSILTPASYCGLVGLRPTFGLVSRHGAMALSWSMDKIGPLAHTVADCARILEVIGVPDPLDPVSSGRRFTYAPERFAGRRWRFGVVEAEIEDATPDVSRAHAAFVARLEQFGSVEKIVLPDLPYNEVATTVILAEAGSAFEDMIESGAIKDLTAPEGRGLPYTFHSILAKDYIRALRVRSRIATELAEILSRVDVLIAPATHDTAPPIDKPFGSDEDHNLRLGLSAASNLAGVPAISLPIGHDSHGLPIGLQLVANAFADDELLSIAAQLEGGWDRRIP